MRKETLLCSKEKVEEKTHEKSTREPGVPLTMGQPTVCITRPGSWSDLSISQISFNPIPYDCGSELERRLNFRTSCFVRWPWQPSANTVALACSSMPRWKVGWKKEKFLIPTKFKTISKNFLINFFAASMSKEEEGRREEEGGKEEGGSGYFRGSVLMDALIVGGDSLDTAVFVVENLAKKIQVETESACAVKSWAKTKGKRRLVPRTQGCRNKFPPRVPPPVDQAIAQRFPTSRYSCHDCTLVLLQAHNSTKKII